MDDSRRLFEEGDWWERGGAFRLLHDINPLRLRLARETLGGTLAGRRILDIGCGGGVFAEAAAKEGAKVAGCDIAEGAIRAAKAHAEKTGATVDYRVGSPDMAEAGQYDAAFCLEMLEHADNPSEIVAAATAMIRPGGTAIFSTVNRTWKARALMIGGLEVALRLLPPGSHQYSQFIMPSELTAMCEDAGLSVKRICGMQYSFFGKRYFLRDDSADVNYFLIAERR